MHVAKNGALLVDEQIEYFFSGFFSGGYRDIPLRQGESIRDVSVLENGRVPARAAAPTSAAARPAGTFGVAHLGGRDRIVWHYQALDEARTFEIRYTLSGVAVAYDDVVDVNLNVWGDEWKVGPAAAHRDARRARAGAARVGQPGLRPRRRPARRAAR